MRRTQVTCDQCRSATWYADDWRRATLTLTSKGMELLPGRFADLCSDRCVADYLRTQAAKFDPAVEPVEAVTA